MIRKAKTTESKILTDISFAAKRYWNYPQQNFDIWHDELTITDKYIEDNAVFVYQQGGQVIAYYSIVQLESDVVVNCITIHAGLWLEHMFVLPDFIGQGIGRQMFKHMAETLKQYDVDSIGILADPNAKGFYQKLGCRYIGEYPSSIKDRSTPHFEYVIT